MTASEISADGFRRETFLELLARLQTRYRSLFGMPDLDITDPAGEFASFVLPVIERLDEVLQLLEIVATTRDPRRATGQSYAAVAALRGVRRKIATVGRVEGLEAVFDDAVGGDIARGAIRFHPEGQPENVWINSEALTIPDAGTYVITAESELATSAAYFAAGATLEILEGPAQLTGFAEVPGAIRGSDLESELSWRLRSEKVISEERTDIERALEELPNILAARVIETPGRIEVIVSAVDGYLATVSGREEVALTVLRKKAQGVVTIGSQGFAVTNDRGERVPFNYSPATTRDAYVSIVVRSPKGASATVLRAAILSAISPSPGKPIRREVIASRVIVALNDPDADILSLFLGFEEDPTGTGNLLPLNSAQLLKLPEGNISITVQIGTA